MVLQWIKTPVGIVVGILLSALLVFGGVKLYGAYDEYRNLKHDKLTRSAAAHGDTAKVFLEEADTIRAAGIPLRNDYALLTSSPRVRSNPVAVEVATKGQAVISNVDAENLKLRSSIGQLEMQVQDLEARPEKKGPRAIPYIEPLYSFSNSGGRPMIRAGVDYRLIGSVQAKVEASYEPPPAGENTPSFRLNVGGRITFR